MFYKDTKEQNREIVFLMNKVLLRNTKDNKMNMEYQQQKIGLVIVGLVLFFNLSIYLFIFLETVKLGDNRSRTVSL